VKGKALEKTKKGTREFGDGVVEWWLLLLES